ncbi:hypothetical protein OUZ56_011434 [Daphnia magna]|uniref:Peptidase A2 domain-containing protein n=1 Tax=Daphnia magna TaxID=35525 RepID=A0ABQ9Z1E3_9CRUS|nr:hypothetical protein OUZ56_011434 [Daphnia magna]
MGHHTSICNKAVKPKSVTATVAASPMLKVADGAPLSIEARLFGGVYVQTATVVVEGPNGWHQAIAYIDQGSNATLVRSELAQTLGLQEVGKINLKLQAVGHIHPEKERSVRKLRLRGTIPQAEDIVAEMSHPLLGQSCDRGEEIIGRSPLQERYADMQSGRGVIRATV